MIVAILAVAGGLGAVTRFVIDTAVKNAARKRGRTPTASTFPWATVGINISGSLLLGVLAGFVMFRDGSADIEAVIGTGFCGGYTTFSTASVDTVRLVQNGASGKALINAVATVVLSVGACAAGFYSAGAI